MSETVEGSNTSSRFRISRAALLAAFVTALVLIRNALLVWAFSFGYYRDSNLYVSLGSTLFQKGGPFSAGVVSFPYPFLNALTASASAPMRLVWLQIAIGAVAAGALVYVIWRANRALALVTGVFKGVFTLFLQGDQPALGGGKVRDLIAIDNVPFPGDNNCFVFPELRGERLPRGGGGAGPAGGGRAAPRWRGRPERARSPAARS